MKKRENFQDIIVVQMYEIVKIKMHFQSNYLIFCNWFFYRCGNVLRMKFIYFILTKYEKKDGQNWVLLYLTKDDVR
jgi:hypothetical protein